MELARQQTLFERMKGAAMLDIPTYEEVEADTTATIQAAIVVGIVAIASAVAAIPSGTGAIVAGIVGAFVGWMVWAAVTYAVGTMLGGTATWGELLRTLGFAQAPGILLVLAIVPVLGVLVRLIVAVWMLVAGIIGIRQALDFGTGRAIITAIIGFVLYIIAAIVVAGLLHIPMHL